jgi:hypothetical protein
MAAIGGDFEAARQRHEADTNVPRVVQLNLTPALHAGSITSY